MGTGKGESSINISRNVVFFYVTLSHSSYCFNNLPSKFLETAHFRLTFRKCSILALNVLNCELSLFSREA